MRAMPVCEGRRCAAGAAVDVDGLWNDVGLNIPKGLHAGGSLGLRDGEVLQARKRSVGFVVWRPVTV